MIVLESYVALNFSRLLWPLHHFRVRPTVDSFCHLPRNQPILKLEGLTLLNKRSNPLKSSDVDLWFT
jgi:hypothetical protein